MYKTGDKKDVFRFGNNYRRLHVATMSDVQVAAGVVVKNIMQYVNTTDHVPARWQRRLADPAILAAKKVRWQIDNANGIRIDIEDQEILKKNYQDRIRAWNLALRLLHDYENNLNDILNICPNASEDNMKEVVDAYVEVCRQSSKLLKTDISEYNKKFYGTKGTPEPAKPEGEENG